jgi:hypothetical protein
MLKLNYKVVVGNDSDIILNAENKKDYENDLRKRMEQGVITEKDLEYIKQKREELDRQIAYHTNTDWMLNQRKYNTPRTSDSNMEKINQLENEIFKNNDKCWGVVFERDYIWGDTYDPNKPDE